MTNPKPVSPIDSLIIVPHLEIGDAKKRLSQTSWTTG